MPDFLRQHPVGRLHQPRIVRGNPPRPAQRLPMPYPIPATRKAACETLVPDNSPCPPAHQSPASQTHPSRESPADRPANIPGAAARSLRCAGDLLSTSRLGGAAIDSTWRDAHLLTDCADHWRTEGGARGRRRVRSEPAGHRCALPSRGWRRRPADRLPLGAGTQAAATGNGTRPRLRIDAFADSMRLAAFHTPREWNRLAPILVKLGQVAVCAQEGHLP